MTHDDPGAVFDVDICDVAYLRHEGAPLLARIYRPCGEGPFPALVDMHGGLWSRFDRTRHASVDLALARSGVVVAAFDFRLAPRHPHPAQIQDVHYGIRWFKAHAAEFHADPLSVGGLGGSSGACGMLLLAMCADDPRYGVIPLREADPTRRRQTAIDAALRYVVCLWGVVDPHARWRYARQDVGVAGAGYGGRDELIVATEAYFTSEDQLRSENPQQILSAGRHTRLPPLLCVHGEADRNVPCETVLKFAADWCRAGGFVETAVFPDQPHEFALAETEAAAHAIDVIKQFVACRSVRSQSQSKSRRQTQAQWVSGGAVGEVPSGRCVPMRKPTF